jgi:hypothetical protein
VNFLERFFKQISNIKFNQNPSSGSRVVPADGRTDMTKVIAAFGNYANAPQNWIIHIVDIHLGAYSYIL